MSTNRSTVEAVVQDYFDALYEGDADKMSTVFDASADLLPPHCRLRGYLDEHQQRRVRGDTTCVL